jgi:uncharacterized membrane protein YraQ (UPF0718 family)
LHAVSGKTWRFLGTPVVLSAAIFAVLLLLTPEQANRSAIFTLEAVLNILPFIVLSVGIAAALKASGADQLVARAFEGRPVKAIALASIFGALSPFCSCGVIPLVASLLAAGVPIAPVLAFCIASPIMDPEMFVLTAAGLGLEFALVKTFAAIAMGLSTGYVTLLISRNLPVQPPNARTRLLNPSRYGDSGDMRIGCGPSGMKQVLLVGFWVVGLHLLLCWKVSWLPTYPVKPS